MSVRPSLSWLWLLVLLQLLIPLSYYVWRDDRDDERFAWRMFSVVRTEVCEVEAREHHLHGTDHPIHLAHVLHASWIRSLERGRRRVIERFLSARCAQPAVQAASLERRCKSPSQTRRRRLRYHYDCLAARLEVAQ